MNCDLCGYEGELTNAIVEGTILKVCKNCSKFGNIVEIKRKKVEEKLIIEEKFKEEGLQFIVKDFSTKIKEKREELGLKQEELAKKISEKESVISKLEKGMKPSLKLAKKLEDFFGIKLIEDYTEETKEDRFNFKNNKLTIGDLLKSKDG